jgi:GDP-L-fucose synthase
MNSRAFDAKAKIFIAGDQGLVGSAIARRLMDDGYTDLLTRTHRELDLTDQRAVDLFFAQEKPNFVFLAAAKVGGIYANDHYPAEFIHENLAIQTNVIHSAWRNDVSKLLFLGSSCIYPKLAPQPLKEEYLLTGPLEPTNQWYAVAKIAGVKMCQAYRRQYGFNAISVMPTNLYGPGDNFDPQQSHVVPGLIRRFHHAKQCDDPTVAVWGTGDPKREFLYVDDLADAAIFLMRNYDSESIVNVGSGEEVTIRDLARTVGDVVGYSGDLTFDASKPDGTPRKRLDTAQLDLLGWSSKTDLRTGLAKTYAWFVEQHAVRGGAELSA